MAGRRDPLLPKLLALELQFEAVVVRRRRGALHDAAPLEHLHADVALVFDGFGNERLVKRLEHLALAPRRNVHFHIETDVSGLRTGRCGKTIEPERGGRRDEGGPQDSSSVHVSLHSRSARHRGAAVSNCVFAAMSLATPMTNNSSGADPVLVNRVVSPMRTGIASPARTAAVPDSAPATLIVPSPPST